jgi:hypothetical protein
VAGVQADPLIAAAVMIGQSELRQSLFVDISLFETCAMERDGPAAAFQLTLPLNVSLTDSMIWRSGMRNRLPRRSGSPLRAGRSKMSPAAARVDSKSCPCQFLSATMTSPLAVPGLEL